MANRRKPSRTLYEYQPYLDWLPELGFSEDELRQLPVHDSPPQTCEPFLSLGYIPPGAPLADPAFTKPAGTRQLYACQDDIPPDLWARLESALHRPVEPSGREHVSMFGGTSLGVEDENDPVQSQDELWPAPPVRGGT